MRESPASDSHPTTTHPQQPGAEKSEVVAFSFLAIAGLPLPTLRTSKLAVRKVSNSVDHAVISNSFWQYARKPKALSSPSPPPLLVP